jgi:hypothetical protein
VKQKHARLCGTSIGNKAGTTRASAPTATIEQVARWWQVCSPFPLLAASQLQACRDGLQRFKDWLGGTVNGVADLKYRTMPHLILPWAAKLARDPRVLDAVEDLLGPDLLIYTRTFFIKEPRSPTIAAWR